MYMIEYANIYTVYDASWMNLLAGPNGSPSSFNLRQRLLRIRQFKSQTSTATMGGTQNASSN